MTKEELITTITKAAEQYYSGSEIMSDVEYDALIEELRILDPTNPLIPGMAADEVSVAGYKKVPHRLTTGTLAKAANMEEFKKWATTHPNATYHCSAKCDGQGFELQYEDSILKHLVSRGTGHEGFDKIQLTKYLPAFPVVPGFTGSIRGEFELDNASFSTLAIFADKKNPRNASAGLMNKKFEEYTVEEIEALGRMQFFAYDIKIENRESIGTKAEIFEKLDQWGFATPVNIVCKSVQEIEQFRNQLMSVRELLDYELDGVVVFENDMDAIDQMEVVQKKAIAIKFDLMTAVSTLKDIEWSLSGAYLTPVAVLEPVELEGVVVTRANLCNLNIISKLGIKIGDKVVVMRRGQVIPRVMSKYVEE